MRSLFQSGTLLVPPVGSTSGVGTVKTISANAGQLSTDSTVILDPSNGSFTYSLVSAIGYTSTLRLTCISTNSNFVTIAAQSSQLIFRPGQIGSQTILLGALSSLATMTAITLVSDGANWQMLGSIPSQTPVVPYGALQFRNQPVVDGSIYYSTTPAGQETMYQVQSTGAGLAWQAIGVGPNFPIADTLPTVSGNLLVGNVLTTSNGVWQGAPAPTFTYQWFTGGTAVGGATSNTYTIQNSDLGNPITSQVTGTNTAGATTASSPPVVVLNTGTGGTAQSIAMRTSAGAGTSKLVYGNNAPAPSAASGSPYLLFPIVPLSQVTDNPTFRLIIHNTSQYTPVQPVLLNSNLSLYNGDGGNLPLVEPGQRDIAGGTSWGMINVSVPGVPTSNMRLALKNLTTGDPSGFTVSVLAWQC